MLTNQATMLTNGVEQGRNLLNGTLNNLAQELEEMSQAQVCRPTKLSQAPLFPRRTYAYAYDLLLFLLCRVHAHNYISQTRRPRTVTTAC